MFLISAPRGFEYLYFIFVLIILFLPIWCIVDILKENFKDRYSKLIWVIIILFFPLIGPIIYLSFLRNNRI